MSYAQIDDQMTFNPKIIAAGNEAVGAWARMLSYCSAHQTDGLVPGQVAQMVAGADVLARLVAVGLLDADGSDYRVHDYLDWNISKADWKRKQAQEQERKRRYLERKAAEDASSTQEKPQSERVRNASKNASRDAFGSGLVWSGLSVSEASSGSGGECEGGTPADSAPMTLVPMAPPPLDFEAVYALYPRKGDEKARPLDKLRKSVTTPDEYGLLLRAVRNYAASVRGNDPKYVKTFKTWVNCWRDFVSMPESPRPSSAVSRGYARAPEPPPRGTPITATEINLDEV